VYVCARESQISAPSSEARMESFKLACLVDTELRFREKANSGIGRGAISIVHAFCRLLVELELG
jgi:hypothetical protein